jgi:hypothetical protein
LLGVSPHKVLWIPEVSLSNFERLVVENDLYQ